MEARLTCTAFIAAAFLALGASHRTENFIVTGSSPQIARDVAEAAEAFRRDLAIDWLGHELPPWQDKCPITVHDGPQYGAGGATSFMFQNGRPFGWTMTIQGSRQRILDSVLPHEVTHTIFATYFGRPLPRWADEGACTTVEDVSERQKQHHMLYEFLTTRRGIAFNEMFAMTEYPEDVLPLYSQGYSLARFLIAQGGKRKFINYVGDGMKWNNWTKATQTHYSFQSLSELQVTWLDWVRQGSPDLPDSDTMLARQLSEANSPVTPVTFAPAEAEVKTAVPTVATAEVPPTPVGPTQVATTQVANADAGSSKGWYSRVRDETVASRNASPPTSFAVATRTDDNTAESEVVLAGQSVSRPQPIQRPGQIVLEWARPSPSPSGQPVAVPNNAVLNNAPPHRVIPDFRGTLWR